MSYHHHVQKRAFYCNLSIRGYQRCGNLDFRRRPRSTSSLIRLYGGGPGRHETRRSLEPFVSGGIASANSSRTDQGSNASVWADEVYLMGPVLSGDFRQVTLSTPPSLLHALIRKTIHFESDRGVHSVARAFAALATPCPEIRTAAIVSGLLVGIYRCHPGPL